MGAMASMSCPTRPSFISKGIGVPACHEASAAPVTGAWMPLANQASSSRPGTRCLKRRASLPMVMVGEPSRPRRSLTLKAMSGALNSIFESVSLCDTAFGSKAAKPPLSVASSV